MYGFKVEKLERCVHIVDATGRVCGVVTLEYAERRSDADLIAETIGHLEPKKPKIRREVLCDGDSLKVKFEDVYYCPLCGWRLGKESDVYKYYSCANCGQVIDYE